MMTPAIICVVGALFVVADTPPELPELEGRLAAVDARSSAIEDLSAKFTQHKFSFMLRKPMESTGDVRVRDGIILWDTHAPIESVVRVDDQEAQIYYADQQLLEVYRVGVDLRFLAGSPVPQIASLSEQFEIVEDDDQNGEGVSGLSGPALVVSLVPREEELKERLERIRLVLDESTGVVRLFEMFDTQGDRTRIVFESIRINSGLSEDDVALDLPDDVRVSHPMRGIIDAREQGASDEP